MPIKINQQRLAAFIAALKAAGAVEETKKPISPANNKKGDDRAKDKGSPLLSGEGED